MQAPVRYLEKTERALIVTSGAIVFAAMVMVVFDAVVRKLAFSVPGLYETTELFVVYMEDRETDSLRPDRFSEPGPLRCVSSGEDARTRAGDTGALPYAPVCTPQAEDRGRVAAGLFAGVSVQSWPVQRDCRQASARRPVGTCSETQGRSNRTRL